MSRDGRLTSTAGEPSPSRSARYRELDALRGFAAIGVVLWHYSTHFRASRLPEILQPFYRAGYFVTLVAVAVLQLVLVDLMQEEPFRVRHNDLYHFFLNLTLSNFVGFQQGFSFNAPSWSISTEIYANAGCVHRAGGPAPPTPGGAGAGADQRLVVPPGASRAPCFRSTNSLT